MKSTKQPDITDADIEDVLKIVSHGSALARRFFRCALPVDIKQDSSPVTQADRQIEEDISKMIMQRFPGHGLLGEERGVHAGDGSHLWVIDPIDGTRSFVSGYPTFGLLLAYLVDGVTLMGAVAMPALDEVFIGIHGRGATRNGKAIGVSDCTDLQAATIYLNEAEELYRFRPQSWDRLLGVGRIRRFAHDCYSHVLVASGFADIALDHGLKPYDFLPLKGLVEAAGGVITDWSGRPLTRESAGDVITSATPGLHQQALALLR